MIAFHSDGEPRRRIADAPRRFQFGLSSLIWLTFGAAIFFAQVTSFPLLFSEGGSGTLRSLISMLVAWSLLFVVYYRRRFGPPLLAHCVGPLFIGFLMISASGSRPMRSWEDVLAASYVGFLASELVSIPMFFFQLGQPDRRVPMQPTLPIRMQCSPPQRVE
jgi:hypothetical protein